MYDNLEKLHKALTEAGTFEDETLSELSFLLCSYSKLEQLHDALIAAGVFEDLDELLLSITENQEELRTRLTKDRGGNEP